MNWAVFDNVSLDIVATFDQKDKAIQACGALNLQGGPGGRYCLAQQENGMWKRDLGY